MSAFLEGLLLPLPEAGAVHRFLGHREQLSIITAVVDCSCQILEGELILPYQVSPPQLVCVDAYLLGGGFHEPLDSKICDVLAVSAVAAIGRFVGHVTQSIRLVDW